MCSWNLNLIFQNSCQYKKSYVMQYILSQFGVVGWLITRGLDLMIGFFAPSMFTQLRTTGNTALSLFYTLSNSPLHTHSGSQIFTCPNLAKELTTVCHFKSHMKSFFHNLIPLLPLFYNCQFRRLDSIQFEAHILASRNSTLHFWLLFYTRSRLLAVSFHNPSPWTPRKTQPILLTRRV
jgi:hypothetical protein